MIILCKLNNINSPMQEFKTKIIVCPDKFKGTLDAKSVSKAISQALQENSKQSLDIEIIPLADGGQGSVQILFNYFSTNQSDTQPQWVHSQAHNPLFKIIDAKYFIYNYLGKRTAFIESAYVSGLTLLCQDQRNPQKTSTFGTGELIKHAIFQSLAEVVYLFVGGSATNDGGIGTLQALGFYFYQQKQGASVILKSCTGGDLIKLIDVKYPQSQKQKLQKIRKTKIFICTDVTNTLTGEKGASKMYAKQKGATAQQIQRLDLGLQNLDTLFFKLFDKSVKHIAGSGASGGLPASLLALLNVKNSQKSVQIKSGIQTIFQLTDFKRKLTDKNILLVVTGEGKVDEQTFKGKVVHGVIQESKENQLPVWIVCGINQLTGKQQKQVRQTYINIEFIPLMDSQTSIQEAKLNTEYCIREKLGRRYKEFRNFII